MKLTNFHAWLNEQLTKGKLDTDQVHMIQAELQKAPNNTLNEAVVSLYIRVSNLESALESLKTRIKSNDSMVWEMFAAIIDKLTKYNIIVSLPVQAKYDPSQMKLEKDGDYY